MRSAATHVSPYSGSWYPGEPGELTLLLDRLWEQSERRCGSYLRPDARGFIVPHAGLAYSGGVSAAAYRHIEKLQPERVVLLGFSHRGGPPGVAMPETERFETPLGDVQVDVDTVRQLASSGGFRVISETALCDHSVEIQLPLLQKAAPRAKIIPLYVGESHGEGVAETLAGIARTGAILIASSDFTHFGDSFRFRPFPVDEETQYRLQQLDQEVIDSTGSLRRELFFKTLRATSATVCGYSPISLLLETMRLLESGDEIFQEKLDYQTSGEITGDFHHSVSYAALGFFPYGAFLLGEEERRILVESARRTLQHFQETGRPVPVPPENPPSALEQRTGAFVTLTKGGELRGCVGRHISAEPLSQAVPALTLAAALEDSRFDAVKASETGIQLEVSVMSPLKLAPGTSSFRVNEHGAFLESGYHRGLLLPQVATEREWTAAQFFDALARKTGVSPKAYSAPTTRLFLFRAQVFQ